MADARFAPPPLCHYSKTTYPILGESQPIAYNTNGEYSLRSPWIRYAPSDRGAAFRETTVASCASLGGAKLSYGA